MITVSARCLARAWGRRSVRSVDQLEHAGVVGAADGSLPRPVLMTVEKLEHTPEITSATPDPAVAPVNELARARAARKSKAPVG